MRELINLMVAGTILAGTGHVAAEGKSLPWRATVKLESPGEHSVRVDERDLHFRIPDDAPDKAGRHEGIITRGEAFNSWFSKMRGSPFAMSAFGMSWNFYELGIPILGLKAQFSIHANVNITPPPGPGITGVGPSGRVITLPRTWDYSWPGDLKQSLAKFGHANPKHHTPVEEVIINGRRWYHYLRNSSLYPNYLQEYYLTGLAPDRYLEVEIRMGSLPFYEDMYPRYPAEEHQPEWLKRALKNKDQVISSLRLTRIVPATVPDPYEVQAEAPDIAGEEARQPTDKLDRDSP